MKDRKRIEELERLVRSLDEKVSQLQLSVFGLTAASGPSNAVLEALERREWAKLASSRHGA